MKMARKNSEIIIRKVIGLLLVASLFLSIVDGLNVSESVE